jgi:hypothetical protein
VKPWEIWSRLASIERFRRVALAALAVLYTLVLLNSVRPVLRFSLPAANGLFLSAAAALPWIALLIGFKRDRRGQRFVRIAVLSPLLLIGTCTFPFGCYYGLEALTSKRESAAFRAIDRIQTPGYEVVSYETNCGIPCDIGLSVRQERILIPGVLLVRRLGSYAPVDDVHVTLISDDTAEVIVHFYKVSRPDSSVHDTIPLKPFVYF